MLVANYNRLNAGGAYSPLYGIIYFDQKTGEIWTNEYYDLGHNSWTHYDNPDIVNLSRKMCDAGIDITMANVKMFTDHIQKKEE